MRHERPDKIADKPFDMMTACLISFGYRLIHTPDNPLPYMMFIKGYTVHGFRGQAFHLHIRYPGDWDEPLFCAYLRKHPAIAAEYVQLKRRLAMVLRKDRDAYTEAKTFFIKQVTERARHEVP